MVVLCYVRIARIRGFWGDGGREERHVVEGTEGEGGWGEGPRGGYHLWRGAFVVFHDDSLMILFVDV